MSSENSSEMAMTPSRLTPEQISDFYDYLSAKTEVIQREYNVRFLAIKGQFDRLKERRDLSALALKFMVHQLTEASSGPGTLNSSLVTQLCQVTEEVSKLASTLIKVKVVTAINIPTMMTEPPIPVPILSRPKPLPEKADPIVNGNGIKNSDSVLTLTVQKNVVPVPVSVPVLVAVPVAIENEKVAISRPSSRAESGFKPLIFTSERFKGQGPSLLDAKKGNNIPQPLILQARHTFSHRGQPIVVRLGFCFLENEPINFMVCFPEIDEAVLAAGGYSDDNLYYGDFDLTLKFMTRNGVFVFQKEFKVEAWQGSCSFPPSADNSQHIECEDASHYDENFISHKESEFEKFLSCILWDVMSKGQGNGPTVAYFMNTEVKLVPCSSSASPIAIATANGPSSSLIGTDTVDQSTVNAIEDQGQGQAQAQCQLKLEPVVQTSLVTTLAPPRSAGGDDGAEGVDQHQYKPLIFTSQQFDGLIKKNGPLAQNFIMQASHAFLHRGKSVNIRFSLACMSQASVVLMACFPAVDENLLESEGYNDDRQYFGDCAVSLQILGENGAAVLTKDFVIEAWHGTCAFPPSATDLQHLKCQDATYFDDSFISRNGDSSNEQEHQRFISCILTDAVTSKGNGKGDRTDKYSFFMTTKVKVQPKLTPTTSSHVQSTSPSSATETETETEKPPSGADVEGACGDDLDCDRDLDIQANGLSPAAQRAFLDWDSCRRNGCANLVEKLNADEHWYFDASVNVELVHFGHKCQIPELIGKAVDNLGQIYSSRSMGDGDGAKKGMSRELAVEILAVACMYKGSFAINVPEEVVRLAAKAILDTK